MHLHFHGTPAAHFVPTHPVRAGQPPPPTWRLEVGRVSPQLRTGGREPGPTRRHGPHQGRSDLRHSGTRMSRASHNSGRNDRLCLGRLQTAVHVNVALWGTPKKTDRGVRGADLADSDPARRHPRDRPPARRHHRPETDRRPHRSRRQTPFASIAPHGPLPRMSGPPAPPRTTRPPGGPLRGTCATPGRGHAKGPGGDPPPGPFDDRDYSDDRFGRHTTSALVCWTSWYGTRSRR